MKPKGILIGKLNAQHRKALRARIDALAEWTELKKQGKPTTDAMGEVDRLAGVAQGLEIAIEILVKMKMGK